jgi:GNAT superfamily N-acetyltransferase
MAYSLHDSNPLSESSHSIAMKRGFVDASRLSVMKRAGRNEWLVHSVFTKDEDRGKGLAKRLIAHVEAEYGPVVIESENDAFWERMGFAPGADGMWRRSHRAN